MKQIVLFAALLLGGATGALAGPVAPLDRGQARALADAAGHGRPTVVALWSSECTHCKGNLALFAALVRREPRLRLVTVAAEPADAALAEPLDRLEVPGERYAWGADAPEALAYALDPKWRGELPRTLFFDGRGGRQAVSGRVDEATARRLLGL